MCGAQNGGPRQCGLDFDRWEQVPPRNAQEIVQIVRNGYPQPRTLIYLPRAVPQPDPLFWGGCHAAVVPPACYHVTGTPSARGPAVARGAQAAMACNPAKALLPSMLPIDVIMLMVLQVQVC